MNYPDNLSIADAEASWATRGPDSSGVAGWILYRGHMFPFEDAGHYSAVEPGIPVSVFIERYRDDDAVYRQIVADLTAKAP